MTASTVSMDVVAGVDRLRRVAPWVLLVSGVVVLQVAATGTSFPRTWDTLISDPVDSFQTWARANRRTHPLFTGFFTPLSRSIDWSLTALADFLKWLPWYVIPAVVFWVIARTRRYGRATVALVASLYPGLVGLWDVTMETLALMSIAVFISLLVGIPLGVVAAFRPRFNEMIRPVLDAMQTIPSFVYIIPVVMLFTLGPIPGIIASVLYAVVPGIRLTALGVRQVSTETVEASQAYGATPRQTLFGVRLPLAAPTILAGVNQIIMMVLAMIIIAGLVGGGALGFETIRAVTRSETGLGFEVALAVVTMAIILDRVTQAWAERLQPPT